VSICIISTARKCEQDADVKQIRKPDRHTKHWVEVSFTVSQWERIVMLIIHRFYIVYVVWLAIETTIIWFLYPETKGPTLEELGRLFEDENPLSKGKLDLEKAHDDDAVHLEEKPK
jgi:hypothetical protein